MAEKIKGLTIVLGADAKEFIKALRSADSEIKATQSNLRDISKALKFDPANVNLLKDKQQELGSAIQQTKEKLELEYEALKNMDASGVDKTSDQFKNLKLQMDLDEAELKKLQQEMRDFGTVGGQVLAEVGRQMQDVGNKIKGVGDKISEVGRGLTTTVTTPIVGGFGAAIKVTADFDEQMSKVKAISGATAEEFDQLRDKAREMGASSKFSATEAGQGLEYMAMAGWKSQDMLNGLPGIMNLAAASGEELGTTSDIVTDALTAFGMKAEESSHFADILAAASANANTNVSMMGESFKYVAPVAGSLGYSAEDVAVALGLMANSGIKADMAGTSLRNMLNRMAKPTKESEVAMERLGLSLTDSEGNMLSFKQIMDQMRGSFQNINMPLEDYNKKLDELDAALADGSLTQKKYDSELEELNKQAFGAEGAEKARAAAMLGGTRAMAGLLAISNATEEDYKKLTDAVNNSSEAFAKLEDGSVVPLNEALASGQEIIKQYDGAAAAMASTMQDNLNGDVTTLKSMLEELAISVGDLLMPLVRDIVEQIQSVVTYLNGLDDAQKEQIIQIAAIVAAIGPALIVIGQVVSAVGTIVTAMGTISTFIGTTLIPAITAISAPVLAVVAAVAALAAGFVYLYKTNEDFRNKVNELISGIKENFNNMVQTIKPAFEELFKTVKQIVQDIIAGFKDFMNTARPVFEFIATGIAGVVNGVMKAATPIVNAVNSVIKMVTSVVKAMFALLKGDFSGFTSHMGDGVRALFETIGNVIKAHLSFFQGLFETFGSDIGSKAMQWGIDMINSLIDGIMSMIDSVGDAISSVADVISSFIHFSEPDEGPLKNFHTFMPDMIKELTSGIKNGIPSVQNAMDSLTSAMVPASNNFGGSSNVNTMTQSNSININVYGAQGQNVDQLAEIIQDKIAQSVVRRGVAFG